jgi:hypothetical protein
MHFIKKYIIDVIRKKGTIKANRNKLKELVNQYCTTFDVINFGTEICRMLE